MRKFNAKYDLKRMLKHTWNDTWNYSNEGVRASQLSFKFELQIELK